MSYKIQFCVCIRQSCTQKSFPRILFEAFSCESLNNKHHTNFKKFSDSHKTGKVGHCENNGYSN